MKLAIMQPYFLPYIGYYQLANSVDTFVIYDNLKYTKKGWINRNRYKVDGTVKTFTLPLGKASDFANIAERRLAENFNYKKELNTLLSAYRKAPFLSETAPLLEDIYQFDDHNLFNFIDHSLQKTFSYLNIKAPLLTSSSIDIDHDLRGEEKVIALCKQLGASTYINPPGGIDLYQSNHFNAQNITLQFLRPCLSHYNQGSGEFAEALSILDLLMWVGAKEVKSKHLIPTFFQTETGAIS